jgi:hypothetical protein
LLSRRWTVLRCKIDADFLFLTAAEEPEQKDGAPPPKNGGCERAQLPQIHSGIVVPGMKTENGYFQGLFQTLFGRLFFNKP